MKNNPTQRVTLAEARTENLTLTELKAENRQLDDEGPELYVPGSGQAPPVKPQHHQGVPIPEGVTIQQPAKRQPDMVLATPPGRICSIAEQKIFDGYWDKIYAQEAEEAALAEAKKAEETTLIAEVAKWKIPYPIPPPGSPDLLPFEEAQALFGYATKKGFEAFLRRHDYSEKLLADEIINRQGCEILQQKERDKRHDDKKEWDRTSRPKRVPEPIKQVRYRNQNFRKGKI